MLRINKTSLHHWLLYCLLDAALTLGASCSDTDLSGGDPAPPGAADPGNDDLDLGPTSISGRVIAIDRETGIELSTEEYLERAGLLLVYLLEDPDDLTQVVDKRTLSEPGPWLID